MVEMKTETYKGGQFCYWQAEDLFILCVCVWSTSLWVGSEKPVGAEGRKRRSGNAPPGLGRAVVWPPPEEGGKRGAVGAEFLQRVHRTCCCWKNRKSRKRRKGRAT